MSNLADRLIETFAAEVRSLPAVLMEKLGDPDDKTVLSCARDAVHAAIAPIIWGRAIGERLNTTEVTKLLRITRQALHKKVSERKLIGILSRNTTEYPRWQFDEVEGSIHSAVPYIMAAFAEGNNDAPHSIAAWAMRPHAMLDGETPAAWISGDKSLTRVLLAARRDIIPRTREKKDETLRSHAPQARRPEVRAVVKELAVVRAEIAGVVYHGEPLAIRELTDELTELPDLTWEPGAAATMLVFSEPSTKAPRPGQDAAAAGSFAAAVQPDAHPGTVHAVHLARSGNRGGRR